MVIGASGLPRIRSSVVTESPVLASASIKRRAAASVGPGETTIKLTNPSRANKILCMITGPHYHMLIRMRNKRSAVSANNGSAEPSQRIAELGVSNLGEPLVESLHLAGPQRAENGPGRR